MFAICSHTVEFILPNEPDVPEQIVITEKTSQAKDIRDAVGGRYGIILPAEGHLFDLLEPEDVEPAVAGLFNATLLIQIVFVLSP